MHAKAVTASLAVALAISLGAGTGWGSVSLSRAKLQLTSTQPLVVRGVAFTRHERVSLVLRSQRGAIWRRNTTASRSGAFTQAFPVSFSGRCNGFSLSATGRAGSRAVLRHPPLPGCSPA